MLGLPASVKAPALAATGSRAVAQLKAPWNRNRPILGLKKRTSWIEDKMR